MELALHWEFATPRRYEADFMGVFTANLAAFTVSKSFLAQGARNSLCPRRSSDLRNFKRTLSDFSDPGCLMGEMQATSDAQLLRDYAEYSDEAAFRELVTRHTDFVYSAALRQVYSPDLAGDLTQSVFSDLARKAQSLAPKMPHTSSLAGWLHRSTRYAALNHLRDTRRRLENERQAMEQLLNDSEATRDWALIRPALDEALDSLGNEDREVLLLRFFKNQDFRAVGLALGVSDDAAQKRVSRALQRLRKFFAKRGIALTEGGLAVVICANAVQAAPVGLAIAISSASLLAGTAASSSTVIAVTRTAAMTTIQKTLITATLAAALGTSIYEARQASILRAEVEAKHLDSLSLTVLRQENEKLSAELARNHESPATDRRQLLELMRLRGQVTLLRRELSDSKRESARAAGSHAPQEAPKSDWNWPAGQFIPRANWVNAGFSKPEATIQTVLWAMATGAGDQFVNAFPPGDGGEVEPPDKLLSRMQFTTDRFFGASGATVDSLNAVGNDRADVMLHVTWADASNSNELLIVKKGEDGAWRIAGGATPDLSHSLLAGPQDQTSGGRN